MSISSHVKKKTYCKKCILHSKVPKVEIYESGLCNECTNERSDELLDKKIQQNLIRRTEKLFEKTKKENNMYDVLVLYSGGKDSTALLNILKEKYNLKVLALQVVHPIVGKQAEINSETGAKKIGVDLIKIYQDEDIYKKFMKYALLNSEKYELGETGCEACSFLYRWTGFKMAMHMRIPIIADGFDKSQGRNIYRFGQMLNDNAGKGILPYGNTQELFYELMGEHERLGLYKFDVEDLAEQTLPTFISPFTFFDYDFRDNEKEFERIGINTKLVSRMNNMCKAIHLFDLISFKKYDCHSFIRHWANGIRYGYPTIEQAEYDIEKQKKDVNREKLIQLMDEYKEILFFVADNIELGKQDLKKEILRIGTNLKSLFSEEALDKIMDNILNIQDLINYFDLNLEELNIKGIKNENTGTSTES